MNNVIKRVWNKNAMVNIEDLRGMAFQAESGGHTFQISGIDGDGNPVALSGTPAGVMLRSDNQDVALTCSISDGKVNATLPANAYSVPGRFGITIFLTSDGQKTAIYAAAGTVGKTSSGTVAPPAGSDVVDLVNAIAAAVATIPASYTDLMAAMAPTYSSSGLYAVGNYAWYNGKLYRCTTPITSGETWTSGHWTLANLGSDLVDLKSALERDLIPITFKDGYAISKDSGTEYSSSNFCCTDYIDISNCSKIAYSRAYGTSSTAPTHGMAFFNGSKEYISGIASDYNASQRAGYINVVDVPSGAVYARFSYWKQSIVASDKIIPFVLMNEYQEEREVSAVIQGTDAWKKAFSKNLSESTKLTSGYAIRYNTGEAYTNTSISSKFNCTDYIDLTGISKIIYQRNLQTDVSIGNGMAFYNSSKEYVSGIASEHGDAFSVYPYIVDVPSSAKYARFTVYNDAYRTTIDADPFYVHDYSEYDKKISVARVNNIERENKFNFNDLRIEAETLGLHTVPESRGVLNLIKRCRQMTEIEWTPVSDLPRLMIASPSPGDENINSYYLGVFKSGHKYKGLPYGRCDYLTDYGYTYSYVGQFVSFETFITAIENENSIIYKEPGTSLANKRMFPYAAVCSAFTCYALGFTHYYAASEIPSIASITLVGALISGGTRMDTSNIKLGDILDNTTDHTAIITDIQYNGAGTVAYIEVSEETVSGEADPAIDGGDVGGVARRKGFTLDDFFGRFAEYNLYRYTNIDQITYTASKYVNIGNEFDMYRFNNLPCMPYMGEGFKYKSGHIPNTKIVVNCHDYSYMRVFKGDTEIIGSPFALTSETEYVEAGFSETGDYNAYLCNMSGGSNTAMTARCHWTVA